MQTIIKVDSKPQKTVILKFYKNRIYNNWIIFDMTNWAWIFYVTVTDIYSK